MCLSLFFLLSFCIQLLTSRRRHERSSVAVCLLRIPPRLNGNIGTRSRAPFSLSCIHYSLTRSHSHSYVPQCFMLFHLYCGKNRFFPSNPVSFKKYYSFVHIFCLRMHILFRAHLFLPILHRYVCVCECECVCAPHIELVGWMAAMCTSVNVVCLCLCLCVCALDYRLYARV